jgi:PAS domain S-box-containing protein
MQASTPHPSVSHIALSNLAKTFMALFVPAAILVGGMITFLYLKETGYQQAVLKQKAKDRLAIQQAGINSHIKAIATDVLIVSNYYELRRFLDTGETRHLDTLAKEFLWFSKIKRIYDQVRLLDDRGMEVIRINFNHGNPGIVPKRDLQSKGERYYFKDTFQLSENEVFVSPFDLNIEQGRIELPQKPMIRFGTPVFNTNGKKKGVVVLNFLGAYLLNHLGRISEKSAENLLLLNAEGYVLHGPNPDNEWAFMYATKKDRTYAKAFPDAWQKISTVEAGQFSNSDGTYTFTTIRPFSEAQISSTGSAKPYAASERLLKGSEYHWKLVSHILPDAVHQREDALFSRMVVIYILVLALLVGGALFGAYANAKRRQSEQEIKKHRDFLKEMVQQRTAELTRVNEKLEKDIDERKQVEEALRESEENYRSMMEAMDDAVYICSDDLRIIYMNPAMVAMVGSDALGKRCYERLHGLDAACPWCVHEEVIQEGHVKTEVLSPRDGKTYHVSNSPLHHADGTTSKLTIYRDISEIKKIEIQLQQAQKLESVGRLAGGVAHDYNNALSVIMGFAELAMDEVDPQHPIHTDLTEILKAAHNASDITKQLLAFARKQTIAPSVLDLNSNVAKTLKMLERLIGENIELVWNPETNLWPVKIDPAQINQVLANLCVNARDAIEGVGKLTIETQNSRFDTDFCATHPKFVPGEYVLLAVHDDGCGMTKEILDNIFDPFFTTKDVEKGTGLGLATVYGIVKQNDGFIDVKSTPGKGSGFYIYLPHHHGDVEELQEIYSKRVPSGHAETLLLVEDDASILKLAEKMLNKLGYNVLTAGTPKEALRRSEGFTGEIDLLVTDIIMPEMNGLELANRMVSRFPKIKHLFMTGYTADVIAQSGLSAEGVPLIQKPFTKSELAKIVRRLLDR